VSIDREVLRASKTAREVTRCDQSGVYRRMSTVQWSVTPMGKVLKAYDSRPWRHHCGGSPPASVIEEFGSEERLFDGVLRLNADRCLPVADTPDRERPCSGTLSEAEPSL
jgi:hypothetical protein